MIMLYGSEISWWWIKHPRISILRLCPMATAKIWPKSRNSNIMMLFYRSEISCWWQIIILYDFSCPVTCEKPKKCAPYFRGNTQVPIYLVFDKLPGSMKFPNDRIPSCLIFEFWDFGRIMAVGHWVKSQNRDSRVFHHHHEIFDP
jgi:hypothetical protein